MNSAETNLTTPKPVTLLTGFLGAGKTTLLNEYLTYKQGVRFAIIENEIGEQGIDGDLVMQSEDNFVEMNNGCICCTLNDNFHEILKDLNNRSEQWDELIIEATGIADPAGIALPFMTDPDVASGYKLERIVCLVDSNIIEDQLEDVEETLKQIAFSDILLINKADQVREGYLDRLRQMLAKMNPMAHIMNGYINHYPLEQISTFIREQSEEELPAHNHHHTHSHHHSNINALSFSFTEPFDINALAQRLDILLTLQQKDVYRAKGIIYDPEEKNKVIVQSVGGSLLFSTGAEWKEEEAKTSRIVFIGKKLAQRGYENLLKQCIRTQVNN
ncbi:MAG: GTP-binding protein [Bacteroidota bacterium]